MAPPTALCRRQQPAISGLTLLVCPPRGCGNRHCPRCQGRLARAWFARQQADLLDTTYYHAVFTLPHALRIADLGWTEALKRDVHLAQGLNVWNGKVTFEAVAEAIGTDYVPVEQALA